MCLSMSIALWIDTHPSLHGGRAQHRETVTRQLQTNHHLHWLPWFCFSLSQYTKRKGSPCHPGQVLRATRCLEHQKTKLRPILWKHSVTVIREMYRLFRGSVKANSHKLNLCDGKKKKNRLYIFGIYYVLIISHDLNFKCSRSPGPHGDYNQQQ